MSEETLNSLERNTMNSTYRMNIIRHSRKVLFHLPQILQTSQEPLVDVGHLPDLLHAVAAMEGSRNGEDALIRRVHELLVDIFDVVVLQILSAPGATHRIQD